MKSLMYYYQSNIYVITTYIKKFNIARSSTHTPMGS